MTRSAPTHNARCVSAGEKLAGHVAAAVYAATVAISERLHHLDGYPSGGSNDGKVHTSSADTSTERIAAKRYGLTSMREDLRDAITDAANTVDRLGQLANDILRWVSDEAPTPPVACRDNQHGMDGALEWGDPLCERAPVKKGLCDRCYMRRRRWATDNGVDLSRDYAA